MKHFIAPSLASLALLVAASAAHAQAAPSTLTLQNGSSFQLQGWTRLNGTAEFKAPPAIERPATKAPAQRADRQRRLALEADYQRQKKKNKKKSAWSNF